jgi:hypothetical protein
MHHTRVILRNFYSHFIIIIINLLQCFILQFSDMMMIVGAVNISRYIGNMFFGLNDAITYSHETILTVFITYLIVGTYCRWRNLPQYKSDANWFS